MRSAHKRAPACADARLFFSASAQADDALHSKVQPRFHSQDFCKSFYSANAILHTIQRAVLAVLRFHIGLRQRAITARHLQICLAWHGLYIEYVRSVLEHLHRERPAKRIDRLLLIYRRFNLAASESLS